ncbi:hypothetical protein BDW02DRAFT_570807 [Decorospora gaudefroyi]|uniref:Ribosome biogenesis protein Alb1 n=1 Tax=Decorospora gaudefroyi TaxID=184978 RepID=A0A6A5K829_9PLEO|nr:hypothetical protein BDW02DRAFT_570807 [Decorospora gaudefroyi]
MAKTAKVKKRPVTMHSRAARRAASPSLNLDKKPTHTSPSSTSPSRPSTINPHALAAKDAGIQKKQKKSAMTRAQRLRYQKGLERAEENMDKLEKKRLRSVGKEKVVKERAKGWEDVNADGSRKGRKQRNEDVVVDEVVGRGREWGGDEDMGDNEAEEQDGMDGEVKGHCQQEDVVLPQSVPLPLTVEEDEML